MIYFTKPIETMGGRPARDGGLNPDGTRTISWQAGPKPEAGWVSTAYPENEVLRLFRNVPPPPAKPLECEVAFNEDGKPKYFIEFEHHREMAIDDNLRIVRMVEATAQRRIWVPLSERKPTLKDADPSGDVIVWAEKSGYRYVPWDCTNYTHWADIGRPQD